MISNIITEPIKSDTAIIAYDTITRTYEVKTYKDGHVCCRCEFPAYEDEEGIEPIIFAHWVRTAEDGLWRTFNRAYIEKGAKPICSHCGKCFDVVALDYKRCPECGAHIRKVDGDEY